MNYPQRQAKRSVGIEFSYLIGIYLNHRKWILLITFLTGLLGIIVASLITPIYKSTALIQIESNRNTIIPNEINSLIGNDPAPISTDVVLINSRLVLGKTVDDLQLNIISEPDYLPVIGKRLSQLRGETAYLTVSEFEVPNSDKGNPHKVTVDKQGRIFIQLEKKNVELQLGVAYDEGGYRILITDVYPKKESAFTLTRNNKLHTIELLKKHLTISEQGKNSGMLQLTYATQRRAIAADILNTIIANYLQQTVLHKTEEAQQSLSFLNQHLPDVRQKLNLAEYQLNQYRQQQASIDLSLEAKSVLESMVNIDKQINEIAIKEANIRQLYTQKHPSYIALQEKRNALLAAREKLNESIRKLPQVQQEIIILSRDIEVEQQIFMQLLNKQQELNILKAGTVGNARIIDKAVVHPKPIKPQKLLIIAMFVFCGFFGSYLIVLVRSLINQGIKDPLVIEEIGYTVYATVPCSQNQSTLSDNKLLAFEYPDDVILETFRALRTSLHFTTLEARNNIVMVVGATPSVGKSFVSANLAAVLAMSNKRVLLIDFDLRKGYLHRVFNLPEAKGVADYLTGVMPLAEIIKPTQNANLDVITSGYILPNPSELLMSVDHKIALNELNERYDYIIIDTPPVLSVTDAAIIGQYAGTTLLVAKYAVSTIKEIELAAQRLAGSRIRIQGVILNGVETQRLPHYGYYPYAKCK